MESIDLDVLSQCLEWTHQGHKILLVTVVRTWGSSPRPPGALMAMRADGVVAGSVSGGCIEDDLIAKVQRHGIRGVLLSNEPKLVTYGVAAEEAHRFGLPCGGTLQLAIEHLQRHSKIEELVASLHARQSICRHLDLRTGHAQLLPASPGDTVRLDGNFLRVVLGPSHRLLVIGAGQLSQYLCQTAIGLGFDVTVCDPRSEYADTWKNDRVKLTREMPDDVVINMRPDERTAVIALTHDPKLDDLALMEALNSPAFYVGALGSRVNNQARKQRLQEYFGMLPTQLGKLRGPAGIYMGSKTPSEIALSILAEIVAVKNGVHLPSELDVAMAKEAEGHTSSRAQCRALA